MSHSSQFALLKQRRFAPFFWTQAAGAANDNLLKFAVTVMVTYQLQVSWLPPSLAGLAIGALFILPYLLFSATAGQLADKLEKRRLIVALKDLEVGIAVLAGIGLVTHSPALLLVCIFLFGLHSTVFGPVKYGYLPQHLDVQELTGGNGMVEMGTFVSILLGNLAGGFLVTLPAGAAVNGAQAVAVACIGLAVLGRLAASQIPLSPPSDASLKVNWNPLSETWRNLKLAYPHTAVFRSLLGISWMWLFGSIFLSQFPAFAKDVLQGNEHVASLLLVVFSIGVAVGSLLCETMSRRMVEIGLVPVGALGMTVFALDLYAATAGMGGSNASATAPYSLLGFLGVAEHWRVLADLFGLSLSAGLFSVPMYALVQMRSPATHRSRIIAANNILNALFMVVGSVLAGAALKLGATVQELFLGVAVLNLLVAVYIFSLVPEYFIRFVAFLVTRLAYRFHTVNAERIPTEGAALIVASQLSYADAALVLAVSPRPIRFVIPTSAYSKPLLGFFFRLARTIPVTPMQAEGQDIYDGAFQKVEAALSRGELVCVFQEGEHAQGDRLEPFNASIAKVVSRQGVPIIPVELRGRGSKASNATPPSTLGRGARPRIEVVVGEVVTTESPSNERLRQRVKALFDA